MVVRSAGSLTNGAAPAGPPSQVVRERLDDPAVAAAMVTILDNAELLSTLVLGLSEFAERGDTIIETVASGVREFKEGRAGLPAQDLPSVEQIKEIVSSLTESLPVLRSLLASPVVSAETIATVGMLGEAATAGMAGARRNKTQVRGALGTLRALKDPDVARGMGVLIEIAKSLGQRIDTAPPAKR